MIIDKYLTFFILILGCFICGCSQEAPQKKNHLQSLADDSGQFEYPSKENVISFPQAHAQHKTFRQEWWYLTANLKTQDGQRLATQWTLFRRAVDNKHWYFGHAALADELQHESAFRNGREELGNVVITNQPFMAIIDDWQWRSSKGLFPAQLSYGSVAINDNKKDKTVLEESALNEPVFSDIELNNHSLRNQDWQVKLNLSAAPHFYLQGEKGYSQKHHALNVASHYYSQPFISVNGEVYWQGKWQKVTGKAWLDREWGSLMLAKDQQGWDWFSLRLNEETALMVYGIRSNKQDFVYGSIMKSNGEIQTLATEDIVLRPRATNSSAGSSVYPQSFYLEVAKEDIKLIVDVVNNKQIMRFGIEYFEGMVKFSGSHQGEGFLEMTGYQ